MKNTKTIRISVETHRKLLEFQADKMKAHGYRASHDEIISDALEQVEAEELAIKN